MASLYFGLPSLAISAVLFLMAGKRSSVGFHAFWPLAASIVAFLSAIVFSPSLGFNLWLYGVPLMVMLSIAVWLFLSNANVEKTA